MGGGDQPCRLVFVAKWWFLHVARTSVSLLIKDTTSYHRLGGHSSFAERTSGEKTQKDRPGQCGAFMYHLGNKKVGIKKW